MTVPPGHDIAPPPAQYPQTSLLGPLLLSTAGQGPKSRIFSSSRFYLPLPFGKQPADMANFQNEISLLLDQRKSLMEMMKNFMVEDVDKGRISVLEDDLGKIKTIKNKYQDDIEDFIEKYMDSAPAAELKELKNWETEVADIGNIVKEHAKKIRNRREELFPSPKPVYYGQRSHSQIFISERNLEVQEKIVKVQRQIVEGKLEEASLFPDKIQGKYSLEIKVMDLKLQEHTLKEMQEAVLVFTAWACSASERWCWKTELKLDTDEHSNPVVCSQNS